jgi:hypothetical protein
MQMESLDDDNQSIDADNDYVNPLQLSNDVTITVISGGHNEIM